MFIGTKVIDTVKSLLEADSEKWKQLINTCQMVAVEYWILCFLFSVFPDQNEYNQYNYIDSSIYDYVENINKE